jgi:hypothetical protein
MNGIGIGRGRYVGKEKVCLRLLRISLYMKK